MMTVSLEEIDRQEVFTFLDDLRDSFSTLTYGGIAYLQDAFDVSRQDAKTLLKEWARTLL